MAGAGEKFSSLATVLSPPRERTRPGAAAGRWGVRRAAARVPLPAVVKVNSLAVLATNDALMSSPVTTHATT
jgi:hypothetical protein